MTDEREIAEETWPKQVGRGWNTSDGYRFFVEEKAIKHQARVDDPDDEAGTHPRTVTTPQVSAPEIEDELAEMIEETL